MSETGSAIRIEKRDGPTRCPYCHGDLLEEEPKDTCDTCGAVHHRRCIRGNGACAACARPTALRISRRQNRVRSWRLTPTFVAGVALFCAIYAAIFLKTKDPVGTVLSMVMWAPFVLGFSFSVAIGTRNLIRRIRRR